jgi:hypothetical protein
MTARTSLQLVILTWAITSPVIGVIVARPLCANVLCGTPSLVKIARALSRTDASVPKSFMSTLSLPSFD